MLTSVRPHLNTLTRTPLPSSIKDRSMPFNGAKGEPRWKKDVLTSLLVRWQKKKGDRSSSKKWLSVSPACTRTGVS